ncbi:MAG: quinolinate synthase NadA [Ruminococcus sp.]|nr:quinolinate synthase NadA [Ruminococcus sp.]MCM1382452.1 quinolinate synthase NadA [Muribaculaceae bacterium]
MIKDVQQEILRIKKEKQITVLAHSYQAEEIQEIADYTGDSFRLSELAKTDKNNTVIMCGVHFMAETVKLLSPGKKVILAKEGCGCPMAEQLDVDELRQLKKMYPDHTVVAYINTTAALKTECDVCVTSSSAVEICRKIENGKILFIPDCNLGAFVAEQLPEKQVKLIQGGCPIHAAVTEKEALAAKEKHPDALLLAHPECVPAVTKHADYIGSTSGIVNFAKSSKAKEFIIGTEISIAEHLQFECPEKEFYPLSKHLICPNMKRTTLMDVLKALNGGGLEIEMSPEVMEKASACINKMLELG